MKNSEPSFIGAKGPNFIYTKQFIIQQYGENQWQMLINNLSPAHRAVWLESHNLNKIYPFPAFKELVALFSEMTQESSQERTAEIYAYIADRSLNSVYKMFFNMTSPAFVLKNYPKLWKKFFNTGTVSVPIIQQYYAMINFDLPDIFEDWLPPACLGYSKKAVELAGGRNLSQKLNSKIKKEDGWYNYFYELSWEE